MLDKQPIHIELCIPNDKELQKQVWHEIIKRKLSDSVEVWPYSVAESFAPIKVIHPTSTGEITDVQTAAVAALVDTAYQQNWLAKEIKHAIKNKTNGYSLPPGSQPILIKTKHPHVNTLLVAPFQYDASQLEPKSVYYAVQAVLKEAQKLGFHRVALPVEERYVGQQLDAII
jgi:uncharacterized protein with NAD-binding domain and iron-sulfur cluster